MTDDATHSTETDVREAPATEAPATEAPATEAREGGGPANETSEAPAREAPEVASEHPAGDGGGEGGDTVSNPRATLPPPGTGAFLRERVLFPVVIPFVALALIGFGTLNVSRLLLATSGNKAVLLASLLAGTILLGAGLATHRDRPLDRGTVLGGAALVGLVLAGAGLIAQQVDLDRVEEESAQGREEAPISSTVTATAVDINWVDKQLQATAGNVKVVLDNTGATLHTFVIEGLEDRFKLEAGGGTRASGVFEGLEAGEYVFYCDVPGHRAAGMEGTLVVTEGGAAAGAATGGGATGGGATVEVTAVDINFPEKEFQAPAGEITINYKNEGQILHTLVIEGLEDRFKLEVPERGATDSGTIALEPRVYTLYCDVPGHRAAGMEAKLTVT